MTALEWLEKEKINLKVNGVAVDLQVLSFLLEEYHEHAINDIWCDCSGVVHIERDENETACCMKCKKYISS